MTDNILYGNALKLFDEKDYNGAFELFQKLNMRYECGYCKFAQTNFFEAENIWKNSKIDSPAINWGFSLIKIIKGGIPDALSFFQIRNFLERDLMLFFENRNFDYAEKIIDACGILSEYNLETPKFIGRVLLNEGYFERAFIYLKKSKDICYKDPEVDYLLAAYYLAKNDSFSAKNILKNSLKSNPNYYPIKLFLDKICQNLQCN